MLAFSENIKNQTKCYVTRGTLGHLDLKQPPVKRKPFATILNQDFVRKTELILPEEIYELIKNDFFTDLAKPLYSKVILPLKAIVEGEFFDEYIKKGNVLMLSEGRRGVDKLYTLRDGEFVEPKVGPFIDISGILTLYLDKESYERAGLVGKPDGVKGKRGTKPRWVVEVNLRLPSMLHGKKGFDRIVYAFKNVLSAPVTWLFCDLGSKALTPDPLDIHFPTRRKIFPEITLNIKVNLPQLKPPTETIPGYVENFEDFAVETHEWLSLISLGSPRINPDSQIDSFLCRYVSPGNPTISSKLVKITWQGFFSSSWAHKLFVQALLTVPREAWFAYYVGGFGESCLGGSKDCTILKEPEGLNEYILWEVS